MTGSCTRTNGVYGFFEQGPFMRAPQISKRLELKTPKPLFLVTADIRQHSKGSKPYQNLPPAGSLVKENGSLR
jgi:hypothetical protein